MKMFYRALLGAFCIQLTFAVSAQASWPMNTSHSCSDPFRINSLVATNNWMPPDPNLRVVTNGNGQLMAELDATDVHADASLLNTYRVSQEITLDEARTKIFKAHLAGQDDKFTVPFVIQNLPALSGYFVSNTSSVAISVLFAFLFDDVGTAKMEVQSLAVIAAQGGKLTRYSSVNFSNGLYISNVMLVYSVDVGQETRKVIVASCTYPTHLALRAFETTIGVNDKRVLLENGQWYVEDLKTGDRQPGSLLPVKEDSEFIYLKGQNFSSFYEDYRISKFGGPFQVQDEGEWVNLYTNTKPVD